MRGESLAHYTIGDKLGEGGMGAVYRAVDGKLGREVAIKVLPEMLVGDEERLARFQREARMLASLNHPNIAAIYGIEEADGKPFLVLELVEGETLEERINKGPMPVAEVLTVAAQIATALEAAHGQGIIHRDLKPANVKLDPSGAVKVLDFGLAKAWEPSAASGSGAHLLTASPTLTQNMTAAGVLLGTAGYMSPEQARGAEVDKRSDIWAFGGVLLEMLTGRRAFPGDTVTDVIASLVAREPEWEALPADTPRAMRRLLHRCLEKEADQRLHDIADARIEIEETRKALESGTLEVEEVPAGRRAGRERLLMGIAALAVLMALGFGWMALQRPVDQAPVIRALVAPPEGMSFRTAPNGPGTVTVSPDGRSLAFAAANAEGEFQLWVRELDELEPRPVQGSEEARYPFWSEDGRYLAFFDEDKLRKIEATGGPALHMADAPNGKGGDWNEDGIVLFAPSHNSGIFKVSAAGGQAVEVTEIDREAGENSHRHPRFLPDGRHFVYLARLATTSTDDEVGARMYLGLLDSDLKVPLFESSHQAEVAADHLWYVIEDTLMALPFDFEALDVAGEPFPVAEGVLAHSGAAFAYFSVNDSGVLAYHTGTAEGASSKLVWRDRDGREIGGLGDAASYFDVALSNDGSKAVAGIEDDASGALDLWIFDVERGVKTRFTFNPDEDQNPVWSPDDRRVAFASSHGGVRSVYVKTLGGAAEEELLYAHEGEDVYPDAWSPDGRFMVLAVTKGTGDFNLWLLPLDGEGTAEPLIETEFLEVWAEISSDGRWLAYMSDESGQNEIYVTPFPEVGRKWQVSSGGGEQPLWGDDGRRLWFHNNGVLFEAEVDGSGDSFNIGAIEEMFDTDRRPILQEAYSITGDGERILVNTLTDASRLSSPPITLVTNIHTELGNR